MKKHLCLVCTLIVCCSYLIAQNGIQLIPFSSGYTSPLGLENCGDNRIFVVQKTGQIMICDGAGNKLATPFLNISDRVLTQGNEQGLLGLAFHPNFRSNGYFYVNYINKNGNTQISRFKESTTNHNVAIPTSEKKILEIHQPYSNHNGGCIRFGPDGYLYIGMGDGGSGGDPQNNAQNPSSLLGKMLRIDINSGSAPYNIPPTNPFISKAGYRPEIWALGLRNPWRWSFDNVSGRLFIADVGQDHWEEVDFKYGSSNGGENYGWRCYEGNHQYNLNGCKANSIYTFPKYEYAHSSTTGDCSITGGFVYRGTKYPSLNGKYFFTDYCSGIIRSLTIISNSSVSEKDEYKGDKGAYTSFGEDSKKELYLVNMAKGSIYRIAANTAVSGAAPVATVLLSVYPNPAKTYCTASYSTTKTEHCTVSLYNALGVQLATEEHTSITGKNNWQVAIPANVKGECYITVTSATGTRIKQSIVIQ
jgi:glucose/arabinose dehydrogenase